MNLFQRRPLRRALAHWRERHRHPFNFAIHLLGIPLAVLGVVLFLSLPWHEWCWGVGAFVLGYVLQFLGHLAEGNDVGEWAAIKACWACRTWRWPSKKGRKGEREKGSRGIFLPFSPSPFLPFLRTSPPVLRLSE